MTRAQNREEIARLLKEAQSDMNSQIALIRRSAYDKISSVIEALSCPDAVKAGGEEVIPADADLGQVEPGHVIRQPANQASAMEIAPVLLEARIRKAWAPGSAELRLREQRWPTHRAHPLITAAQDLALAEADALLAKYVVTPR